ncbi:hypothetical protein [Paraburkholderia aromaticivorans]|uniref:hypothetical protein n=1 Tax=Paraburkholderia aromaticivorans TaxID=2026199 RepID=UPI001455E4D9|nr:hypothetical protein [Paraburkholderia aromaticivorans]
MSLAFWITRPERSPGPRRDERACQRRSQVLRSHGGLLALLLPISAMADTALATNADGSPAGAASQDQRSLEPLNLAINAGLTYDDNVSRARDSVDKLSDESLAGAVNKVFLVPLGTSWQVLLNGFAGAEGFRTYTRLSRVFAGLHGELRYRYSNAFYSPTLATFARFQGDEYGSDLRRGYRYSVGGIIEQPVTDRITVTGTISHNQRYAKSDVFAAVDNAARINVDYNTVAGGHFYASLEYRLGDTVSSGQLTLDSIDVAKVFVRDDAFNRNDFFSYRFRAHMYFTTIGYSHPLGSNGTLDFSWRYSHVTPTEKPDFEGAGNAPYVASQFTIAYQLRF